MTKQRTENALLRTFLLLIFAPAEAFSPRFNPTVRGLARSPHSLDEAAGSLAKTVLYGEKAMDRFPGDLSADTAVARRQAWEGFDERSPFISVRKERQGAVPSS